MKDQAIVCNIGHFDNEIQVAELENMPGVTKEIIKMMLYPGSCKPFTFADGKASICLLKVDSSISDVQLATQAL